MRVVSCIYARVQPTALERVTPAPVLEDESPQLCQMFHKALLKSPEGFAYNVVLEGFPRVHFEWKPSCQTAGALVFPTFVPHPNQNTPDLVSFLLNGIESPGDLTTLAKQFPLRADMWQEMMNATKPVALNFLYTVGRMREPATITIINAFANSFFSLFGTNETDERVAPR